MPRLNTRIARDIWWVFLLVLIAHTVLVGFNILRQSRDENLVTHTLYVTNEIAGLSAATTDMHLEIRGYIISGDRQFLTLYQAATARANGNLARLRELTKDNEQQTEALNRLEPLLKQQQDQLQKIADIPEAERTLERVRAEFRQRNDATSAIRTELANMQEEEGRLLAAREKSSRDTIATSVWTAIVGGALVVGMLMLARYLMNREFETRRRGEAAVRLSNERFGVLAESLPQIVWVANADGTIDFFNPQWFYYTGLSDHGGGGTFGQALHPDDQDEEQEHWHKSVQTGETYESEFRLRRYDGSYRWFLGRALPLRNAIGQITQWFGTCTDIDDHKRFAEELEARVQERTAELQLTAAELTRSNKELEQFAYVASHDLQEPLRKIQAFSDRLLSKYGATLEEQGKDYVDRMQNAARRMRQLINDLLTYSRISTRSRIQAQVDLNQVAREVIDDLDDAVTRHNATIAVDLLPTVTADALQMRQLFQNLISNALKFAKPDAPARISIRADEIDRMPEDSAEAPDRKGFRLTFRDNGIGFDPAYSQRIFQVFQRLHGRDEYEGTGIGLAIVRKIVERHGGSVSVESSPGNGATFAIVIPQQYHVGDEDAPAPPSDVMKKA